MLTPLTLHSGFFSEPISFTFPEINKIASAILPLAVLYKPLEQPYYFGQACHLFATHAKLAIETSKCSERSYELFHASLATAAVGLFFFYPTLSEISSTVSDIISNSRVLIEQSSVPEIIEALSFIALDLVYIASLLYASLEIKLTYMIYQIVMDIYSCKKEFIEGNNLAGFCAIPLILAQLNDVLAKFDNKQLS